MEEALYVVEFGTARGVIVFETTRFYGGDSGFYYVGDVKFEGGTGIATGKIVQHDPRIRNAWGDGATSFDVTIRFAKQDDGSIQGVMGRHDMPGIALPIRLTVREKLP